jgi:hypothetical protein
MLLILTQVLEHLVGLRPGFCFSRGGEIMVVVTYCLLLLLLR